MELRSTLSSLLSQNCVGALMFYNVFSHILSYLILLRAWYIVSILEMVKVGVPEAY